MNFTSTVCEANQQKGCGRKIAGTNVRILYVPVCLKFRHEWDADQQRISSGESTHWKGNADNTHTSPKAMPMLVIAMQIVSKAVGR